MKTFGADGQCVRSARREPSPSDREDAGEEAAETMWGVAFGGAGAHSSDVEPGSAHLCPR